MPTEITEITEPIRSCESVSILFEIYDDLSETLAERQRTGKSTLGLTYKEIFDAALTLVPSEQAIRSMIIEDPNPSDATPIPEIDEALVS